MKYEDIEDFLCLVGFGDIQPTQIIGAIAARGQKRTETPDLQALLRSTNQTKSLTVHGVGGVHTRLAHCCSPVAPEPIIGYVTRGQGITIHTQRCPQVAAISDRERLIDVEWGATQQTHPVPVVLKSLPRSGLIEDLVNLLRGQQINVPKTKLFNEQDLTTVYLIAEVADLTQLNTLMTKLGNLPGVQEVRRQSWS